MASKLARRVPLIRFPDRKSPVKASPQPAAAPKKDPGSDLIFKAKASQGKSVGGTAAIQPKRPQISEAELERIMLGGAPM